MILKQVFIMNLLRRRGYIVVIRRYFAATYIYLVTCVLTLNVLAASNNNRGMTALMHAVKEGDVQLVAYFIEVGDVNATDDCGQTALIYAVRYRHNFTLSFIRRLIRAGADVNIIDNYGRTALSYTQRQVSKIISPMRRILRSAGAKYAYQISFEEQSTQDDNNKAPGC